MELQSHEHAIEAAQADSAGSVSGNLVSGHVSSNRHVAQGETVAKQCL